MSSGHYLTMLGTGMIGTFYPISLHNYTPYTASNQVSCESRRA